MQFIKNFVGAACVALVVSLAAASAQAGGMVVVDIQKIMKESTAAQSARAQLQSKQKQFQNELNKRESDLQKKDQELAKQRGVVSKEAFDKQVAAFRKQAVAAQKEVQQKRLKLNKAFNAALADIQKSVTGIIAELAKEKGFDVAIPSSQILYNNASLDISGEVLARLNKKLPKLNVSF